MNNEIEQNNNKLLLNVVLPCDKVGAWPLHNNYYKMRLTLLFRILIISRSIPWVIRYILLEIEIKTEKGMYVQVRVLENAYDHDINDK